MDDDRMKTMVVLDESAKVIARLNPNVFAIMTFLAGTVRDEDEKDFARWVSYYARMSFDKKYGKGASDKAVDLIMSQKPNSTKEFLKMMEDYFDKHIDPLA